MSNDSWKQYKLRFGKFKDQTMYMVFLNEYDYIEWLNTIELDEETREAVDGAMDYYNEYFEEQ